MHAQTTFNVEDFQQTSYVPQAHSNHPSCQRFRRLAGGLGGGGHGDAVDQQEVAGAVVLWEMGGAGLTGLGDGVGGGARDEHHDALAEARVGTFGDEEGKGKVRTERALQLLGLDFYATAADDVVAATKDTEATAVGGQHGYVVGLDGRVADGGGVDDEAVVFVG